MNERGADDASTRSGAPGRPVGVVLAGGDSSRMGADKATLQWGGISLAERALGRLRAVCSEVLVADRGRGVLGRAHSVEDGPGRGPAAGLLGAARAAPGRALLVLACDLPAVPASLLAEIVARGDATGADWVLVRAARGIEPLVALYGPRALEALDDLVRAGQYAPRGLLERDDLRVETIDGAALARHGDPERMLANLNRPEDLATLDEDAPPAS